MLLRVGEGLDRSALVVPALDQLADLSGLDAILVEFEALDELVGFPGVLHRRDRVGAAYLRLAEVLGVEEFVPKACDRLRLLVRQLRRLGGRLRRAAAEVQQRRLRAGRRDRKSTRLNSSH